MRNIRGLDHIAMTVPNMEEATDFFRKAFGAKVAYDLHTPYDAPLRGDQAEKMLGLEKGTELLHMRMLAIGQSASVELFSYGGAQQRSAAISSDIGLQHFAVYVDDIDEAAQTFEAAGGVLFTQVQRIFGEIEGVDEKNRFVYGRAPWGTVIELVTYPSGINYPVYSEAKRFTPPEGRMH